MSDPAGPEAPQVSLTTQSSGRTGWVDNLRTLMIALVVAVHAMVTYSHVFDWYFKVQPEPALATKLIFLMGEATLQSFFMGLLFFLAGYFAEKSLQRRGAGSFLRERAIRLGIPLVLYVAVIHPFIVYGLNPWDAKFLPLPQAYIQYFTSGNFVSGTGPLWFVETLLIFSVVLALWPRSSSSRTTSASTHQGRLTGRHVLWLGTFLAAASFFVRLFQPIETNVINLQLGYFAQYSIVFGLAAWMARRGIALEAITRSKSAVRAGWTALILGPLMLAVILVLVRPQILPGVPRPMFGGWNGFAVAYAVWEQFTGVGLAVGIMAMVSRLWSRQTAWSEWLSTRSFGVYVLHAPVIVALAMLFRGYSTDPYLNTIALTTTGLAASYVVADLAHRIPVLNRVL